MGIKYKIETLYVKKNSIFIHFLKSLTDDEYDMFYEMWQKFDPKGTEFIPYAQLSEFVSNLDEPLGIPRPNRFKLISMNLPICQNETVHCSDILGEQKKGKFKLL
jgi:hypothetical protein